MLIGSAGGVTGGCGIIIAGGVTPGCIIAGGATGVCPVRPELLPGAGPAHGHGAVAAPEATQVVIRADPSGQEQAVGAPGEQLRAGTSTTPLPSESFEHATRAANEASATPRNL
jgi:hypothetical protein